MTASTGKSISLTGVSKHWGDTVSLRDIDLALKPGRFTSILGPSGCGKSTTLRIIAGLEQVTAGRVHIGERDVTDLPPARRNLSMVFQSYALFPHLSVAENIVFGLRVERLARAERDARLAEVAGLLELTPYLDRKPAALSGGQQQRVALGRAVISRRPVCLMDEPLSNLDARLRDEMRREIRSLQRRLGFTMVYVTHDQTEAITMSDEVVLMNAGRIEQVGSPQDIYRHPATPFAARFIGTPPMNLLPPAAFGDRLANAPAALRVGIRPDALHPDPSGALACTLRSSEFLGSGILAEAEAAGTALLVRLPGSADAAPGSPLRLALPAEEIHLFDIDAGRRIEDPALIRHLAGPTQ